MNVMNRVYARRFEFGNTPARATIQVAGTDFHRRDQVRQSAVSIDYTSKWIAESWGVYGS
jgi:hypothetical protein